MAIDPSGINSRAELSGALADLYEAAGLSYLNLATAAGIGSATVHDMVKGKSVPYWGKLEPVLRAFGIRDPKELEEWRQARQRAGKRKREEDPGEWPGPGTAVRVAAADGLILGVHRAISEPGIDPNSLPAYVWRDDDNSPDGVRETVKAMQQKNGFLLLVGGSSVGKTRTLYEVVRDVVPDWWLVQPGSPDDVRDLVNALPSDTRLVVWLDELQRFLGGERGLDAATIADLLRGPGRVMLAGTLWPVYHSGYVARPGGNEADRYATERAVVERARVLRLGEFSDDELRRALEFADGDPRIRRALNSSDQGFTQTMAAGPQLIARWRDADPYGAAVINAALDAARFGVWHPLPAALLRVAAPGYCDDRARARASGDWFETALDYACATVHGAASPLISIAGEGMGVISGYRPADYLLQRAAHERVEEIGPPQLWAALAGHVTDPEDLGRLAVTARIQHFDRLAAVLLKRAVLLGDPGSPTNLLGHLSRAGERRVPDEAVAWAVRHAVDANPRGVAQLMGNLALLGAGKYRTELAERACQHASADDPEEVSSCLRALDKAGETEAVMLLADRAAAETSVKDPSAVSDLWQTLDEVGAVAARATLAARASRECALLPFSVMRLLKQIISAGGTAGARDALIDRIADQAPVNDPLDACNLIKFLQDKGAGKASRILAGRAASDASLLDPVEIAALIEVIAEAEAGEALETLADRAARHAPVRPSDFSLGQDGIDQVILALEHAGAAQAARALADRAARDVPLTSPLIVGALLRAMAAPGYSEAREKLIARTAAGTPDHPWVYFHHLSALLGAGADEAARTLADRAADRMPATIPNAVTCMLTVMREMGADEAAEKLAERAARDVFLDPDIEPVELVRVLQAMDDGNHKTQSGALADRIARDFPLDQPATVGRLVCALASPDFEQPEPWQGAARPVRVFGRAAHALAIRAARETPLTDLDEIRDLVRKLRAVPEERAAETLIARAVIEAPARKGLDWFLRDMHEAGDTGNLRFLADRAAQNAPADKVDIVCALLKTMAQIGVDDATNKLAARAAQEAPITLRSSGYSPHSTDNLLAALHDIGADGPAGTLAERAAERAPLDDPGGIARLLLVLDEGGYHEQARRLAERAAHDAVPSNPGGIAQLLESLDATGAATLLPTLAMRAAQHVPVEDATKSDGLVRVLRHFEVPSAEKTLLVRIARRHFGLYLNLAPPDQQERFRYGREPDGTPSAPWTWNTLP